MKLFGFALLAMASAVAVSPRAISDLGTGLNAAAGDKVAGSSFSMGLSEVVGEPVPRAALPMQPEIAKQSVSDVSTITGTGLIKSARKPALRTVGRSGNSAGPSIYRDSNSATPEPSSLVLLGTGLLGMAFVIFRKAKSSTVAIQE